VHVQCSDVDITCGGEAWEWSALTRGWITDSESTVGEGEEEEPVTGGVQLEAFVVVKP
jgi:hypothetical protein